LVALRERGLALRQFWKFLLEEGEIKSQQTNCRALRRLCG
jgi:hypothetical protein